MSEHSGSFRSLVHTLRSKLLYAQEQLAVLEHDNDLLTRENEMLRQELRELRIKQRTDELSS